MTAASANQGGHAADDQILGDAEFRFLREFVYEHCGIALGEHKRQLVQGASRAACAR